MRKKISPLVPIASLFVFCLIAWGIQSQIGVLSETTENFTGRWEPVKFKILWSSAYVCLCTAILWNIYFSASVISSNLKNHKAIHAQLVLVGIAVACSAFVVADTTGYFKLGGSTGGNVINFIACQGKFPGIFVFLSITNTGSLIAGSLILVATYSTLSKVERTEISVFSGHLNNFAIILYSASGLLAIGLLEIHELYSWGASLNSALKEPAKAIPLAAGLIFSTGLFVVFFPSALIMQSALNGLTQETRQYTPELDIQKYLVNHCIRSTPFSICSAIGLPLLTAIITTSVKSVFS
jgi:hypothetical protein